MAAALLPVEEYLRIHSKPALEYLDGVVTQKSMPTWDHARIQARIIQLIGVRYPRFLALGELHCKLREGEYLVPDVAISERSKPQRPYPTEPVFACVEILSPEDRLGQTLAKCEQYHFWGVLYCWVIDPEKRAAWLYVKGLEPQRLSDRDDLISGEIQLLVSDLFSE